MVAKNENDKDPWVVSCLLILPKVEPRPIAVKGLPAFCTMRVFWLFTRRTALDGKVLANPNRDRFSS